MQMKRSGKTSVLEVGETVVVPAGEGHNWGNPFNEPAAIAVDPTSTSSGDVLRDIIRSRERWVNQSKNQNA